MGNTMTESENNGGPPRFICLCGVDGSGKSTFARMLEKEMVGRGYRTKYAWMRMNYMLTRPVLLYCRLTGLTRRPIVNGRKISIHEFHRSRPVAKLVQYLHLLDTVIAYFFKVFIPMRLCGCYIICDRFVHDVLIDFIMESKDFDLHDKLIRKLLFSLIPKDGILLVETDLDTILERKPDVTMYDADFETRFHEYCRLGRMYDLEVVDNNRAKDEVFADVKKRLGIGE